ncbi:MAG TPA: type II toxin-antitoxin system prevent-host-death family antitoxin [bacterium]|nr:type II toxin-antitoxin system prevent-host-death family antitoxin [bacterium]
MATVGVRELKARLSSYLKRVKSGERLVVTERGRPVVIVSPIASAAHTVRLQAMLRAGAARWAGGKPRGSAKPARLLRGRPVAEAVIEERR